MAIFSDAGALVGTWWNQVTQPQSRGPITEATVNPARLTARTDLDEARQALGKPLPIVIGTGRVDGVYFIGGVQTVATVTTTTETTNDIPENYQAVSGTMGGQTFLFGPPPTITTTSTTAYLNETLAGYVLAYDVFERGYNLVRLEIDGKLVFDIESSVAPATTFRFYGGRHTTTDPILTKIIGDNPGAYQNFVMVFVDGYPSDAPPSISAVISNAVEEFGESSAPIVWTGTVPPEMTENQAGRAAAYDPTNGVIYQAIDVGTSLYLAVLDSNTLLERYRVPLEGTSGWASLSRWVMCIRGAGHVLVRSGSPAQDRIYDATTGLIVVSYTEDFAVDAYDWKLGQPFGARYMLVGEDVKTGSTGVIYGLVDLAADTLTTGHIGGLTASGSPAYGPSGSGSVAFFFNSTSVIQQATFDGTAWSVATTFTSAGKIIHAVWYDPLTGYLVVSDQDPDSLVNTIRYVNPVTGATIDSFTTALAYWLQTGTYATGRERYWPAPGYVMLTQGIGAAGRVYLLDIMAKTFTVYAEKPSIDNLSFTTGVFDQNRRIWIEGFGDDVWTVHRLAGGAPRLIDLEDVITDAMSLAGFGPPDLTFEGIAGRTSYGIVIANDTTVQNIGRSLSDIYGFSWCDTGSGFFFKQAAQGDLFSIDAAFATPDIVERDQPVMSQDEADIRTPSSVEMQYVSKEGQYKVRPVSFNMTTGVLNSITTPKFSTPILFNDDEAQRIVQEKFFEYQEKRRSHSLAVAPEHITLLPGDIVSFPSGTRTYITRVDEIGIDLRNMGVEISARDFQTDVATPITSVSNTGPVWQVVPVPSFARLLLSGDMQSGSDHLNLSGTAAPGTILLSEE